MQSKVDTATTGGLFYAGVYSQIGTVDEADIPHACKISIEIPLLSNQLKLKIEMR